MKKYLFTALLLLTAMMALNSCGSDEPEDKLTATATYGMTFSQDMLNACNVFVIYKAENGRNVMEPITSTWWTKTVTSNKFPAEFGVMYKFSTKSDAELTQEKYNLTCEMSFSGKTSKGASYTNSVSIINSQGVARDKVVNTLDKLSGKSVGFKVTKDGIFSQANNLKYE